MKIPDFTISDQSADEFFNSLRKICRNTGTDLLPSFGKESSFLSAHTRALGKQTTILAIDVGGTRTKVCVRRNDKSGSAWTAILDLDNNQLKSENSSSSARTGLWRMSNELSSRIAEQCSSRNMALAFDGISVVWSNKIQCFPFPAGEIRGVGGKVYGSKDGGAYRKGEWWNQDISDGDDISQAFIDGFRLSGIKTKALIVANDTIFTAKALIGADAGVVASTGANATMVPLEESVLYNSECGAAISLTADLLKLKRTPASIPGTQLALKLEDLCAGKGLPSVFQLLINDAIAQGASELQALAQSLSTQALTSRELAELLDGKGFRGRQDGTADLKAAMEIGQQLVHNAGLACGILILMSVSNQLDQKRPLLVALDSSQARFLKGYRQALDRFLKAWNSKNNSEISYQLLEPQGQISVPLQGAANAISEFLD